MQKYSSNITTSSGSAVRNAAVYVFAEDGSIAPIFSDRLGQLPLANPVITASDGTYSFYAANGRYSLQCTVEGVKYVASDVVLLDDPADVTPGAYAYPLATQAEAEDGANASPHSFTPQRIWQAIQKWWTGVTVPITQGGTGAVNAQGARTALGVDYGTTAGSVAAGDDQRINDGETAFTWGNHALAGYATHAEVAPKLENITGLVLPGTNIAISGSGTNAAPYVIDSGGASGALWGAIGGTLANQTDLAAALAAKANSASLGAAATRGAQVNGMDATPGQLMQVGAFGLGAAVDLRSSIFVTGKPSDLYSAGTVFGFCDGNELTPPLGPPFTYGTLIVMMEYTDASAIPAYTRTFVGVYGRYWQYAVDANTWSPWRQLWDSGNLDPASFATATQGAKADTALQSETDPTVPAWAKAATKPGYTKAEVGLGNVDNTSDASKPVSAAQQAALDLKAALSGGAAANFGAMPQVGGSPIVESGSNTNGTWVKFADGTMICRRSILSLSQGWQSGYSVSYPATFVDNKASVVGNAVASDSSGYATVFSIFNSGSTASNAAGFSVFRYTVGFTDSGTTLMLGYIAIGSWK